MKIGNKIILSLLLLPAGSMGVMSQEALPPVDSATVQTQQMVTEQQVTQADLKALEERISKLEMQLEAADKERDEVSWLSVIGIVGAFICAAAAIYLGYKNSEVSSKQAATIKKLQKQISEDSANGKSTGGVRQRDAIYALNQKIASLENRLSLMTVERQERRVAPTVSVNKPTESSNAPHKEYFGLPIRGAGGNGYFKRFETRNEDARFDAMVTGTEATFVPCINVKGLISTDAMDLAVEFRGRGKNENPTSMQLVHKGKAKLVEDKWVIIGKALVVLE